MVNKFIIICAERTGSNYLTSLLRDHSQIDCGGEELNLAWLLKRKEKKLVKKIIEDPIKYLNNFLFKSFSNNIKAKGFKLIYNHFEPNLEASSYKEFKNFLDTENKTHEFKDNWSKFGEYLKENKDIRIIHLKRKNKLNSLVSFELAKKSGGIWTSFNGRYFNKKIRLSDKVCRRYFDNVSSNEKKFNELFEKHSNIEIFYEDLYKNKEKVLDDIQKFLGVKKEYLSSKLKKQNNKKISDCIINYNELKNKFENTDFEDYFEDDKNIRDKKKVLVTLADENYIDQAKQLFSSVYFNSGWDGDYLLLTDNVSEEKLEWFKKRGIIVKKFNPIFDKNYWYDSLPDGVLSRVVSLKFYLFTEEFKKWDKVVYLDGDIIVRGSIDNLANVKRFCAVKDTNPKLKNHLKNIDEEPDLYANLKRKFKIKNRAFNAGVFGFDTSIITKSTYDELLSLFYEYSKICKFSEQTILNLYFNNWEKKPMTYNLLIPEYKLTPDEQKDVQSRILHFVGYNDAKPWSPNNIFYEEWKFNLERSEEIVLEKIFPPSIINEQKIKQQLLGHFKKNISLFFVMQFRKIHYMIDRRIGLVGQFLYRKHPSVYLFLKKIIK